MSKRSVCSGLGVSAAVVVLTMLTLAVAGCAVGPTGAGSHPAGGRPSAGRAARASATPAVPGSASPATASPTAALAPRVIIRHFALRDGAQMTSALLTGGVRFVLYCGTADPGPLCRGKVSAGQKVGSGERGLLLAAFNGGFKLSAGAGGYEQEGKILAPLRRGLASLVIYSSGAASIGIWGHSVPQPGQQVFSVRQNLVPLVIRGRPTAASSGNWGYWGGTVTGVDDTARSALGENARGQLLYVASMSATPPDLAAALVRAGAVIGMELDINQEWVQFDYASQPGGPLVKAISDQWQPATQYLTGWTRDFIAVLADSPSGPAPTPAPTSRPAH
jgi:hypothetical protein